MKNVFTVLCTGDPDEIQVEVFDTPQGASQWVIGELENDQEEDFTNEMGKPIEPLLRKWSGKKDLDVWCNEGRVIYTLAMKTVR